MKKYLHVFNHESKAKFSGSLIREIQNPENGFNSDEHYFVTYSAEVYDILKAYKNVMYYKADNTVFALAEIINKYADDYDWIFLHGINNMRTILKIKRKYLSKIIWRTWGHDSAAPYVRTGFKRFAAMLYYKTFFKAFVKSIRAVGIANIVDKIAINRLFKINNIDFFPLAYFFDNKLTHEDTGDINSIDLSPDNLNILIGHSAHSNDRHIEITDKLVKFKNENIKCIFPIAYGAEKEKIKSYALKKLGEDKVIFLEEFMPKDEYINLIEKIDIGILAGTISYALGNVTALLNAGKTVYLAKEGVIAEAFKIRQIPHRSIDEIEKMSFEEFSMSLNGVENRISVSKSFEESAKIWKQCLSELN